MGNNSYLYDLNGNETMNLSHGMAYAHYNNRNLPDSVVFLYGNRLTMHYTADGRRMRTRGYTYSTPISVPYDEGDFYGTPLAVFDETRDGALTMQSGVPVRYDFPGGYYTLRNDTTGAAELHPYLYETDLQGSVRVVTDAVADSLVQSMEYLPDGTVFRAEGYPRQAYRYGGKEEMSLHGWNMYDSKARWQYARMPRFSTLDPLAEKYYHVSPYAYCGNDFVNFVDPNGEDHIFNSNGKLIKKTRHGNNIYIQTKDSKVLLSDLNMALKENRQIAANVIGYYAKGLGISYYAKGGIGVGNNPRGTIGLRHYGNKNVLAYNIGDNIVLLYMKMLIKTL